MRFRASIVSLLLVSGPLFLLAPSPGSDAAPIYVLGDIYSTESWSMATSPVHIIGNVTVHGGAVLNIKEGTEVRFDEGAHLNIEGGTLVVDGLMTDPVRFLPNSTVPYRGFYEWIFVNNTPLDQATVRVRWAELSFGVKGFYLDGAQGAMFDNVRFNDTGEAGIYLSQCQGASVRNCTFTGSDGWGIKADFCGNLSLSGNLFSGCAAASIQLSDCEYSSVTSSTVRAGSSEKGVQFVNSAHLLVDGLVIEDAPTGLELERSGPNTVFGCLFSKNVVGLFLNASPDNVFRGNNFSGCDIPLSFAGGPELARNTFELSNQVDGLPVRAVSSGDLDGVPAGAVVLVNSPGSVVSNITFPPKGGAVIVLFGGANTLRDFTLGGSAGGIAVLGSNGILIENVTVNGPGKSGITLWGTQGRGIRDCRVLGCEAGISFMGPMNITVTRTTLKNSAFDLALSEQAFIRALDCTLANVSVDASSRLDEDYTLRVAVRDNLSLPVPGADLMVTHGGKTGYATAHFGGNALLSDAGGTFPPIEATGTVHDGTAVSRIDTTIEVWDNARVFEWNPRTLVLSAPTTAVFSATDMGFLGGIVRDPAGDPVEGVDLALDGGTNCSTGPDGMYRFPPLPPGTYSLNASLAGWLAQERPGVDILLGRTTYINLTLDAAPGSSGEIRGRVSNESGSPIFAAFISIGGGKTTDTNVSGVFRILSAPGGWVNFTVSKGGYLDGRGRAFVPPGGVSRYADVTLVAVGGAGTGMVTGRVLDSGGGDAPIPGALVWVADIPSINNTTDNLGLFSLRGIPPGRHDIRASALHYNAGNITVDVEAGSAKEVTIYLSQETMAWAGLNGYVRDAWGGPVSGATVRLDGTARMTGTGPDGRYSFVNVTAGNYSVTASAPLHGSTTETGVSIPEHWTVTLNIVLGQNRAFTNTSLGVAVSGDIIGDGTMAITRASSPPVPLPGGFDRVFEVTAQGFTCMTNLRIVVTGRLFGDALTGKEPSEYNIRLYTHASGSWGAGDRWEVIDDSGYDESGGFFWANVTHLSVFGMGISAKSTHPTGTTIVALPPWLSPVAVVAIVLLVGVPIGIIVIRVRQPPTGGGKQNAPRPPAGQSGTNLYP